MFNVKFNLVHPHYRTAFKEICSAARTEGKLLFYTYVSFEDVAYLLVNVFVFW